MKKLGLILAGGQSKRLFPVETPKPLLKVGNSFLLQQAIERLKGFHIKIVANPEIADHIRSAFEAENLSVPDFILEPEGRDTAAAVGFGLRCSEKEAFDWVAVLSADHWMKESPAFVDFLLGVEQEVTKFPDALFVGGSPSKSKEKAAHSQFGWVVPKKEKRAKSFPVKVFVEKPSGAKLQSVRRQGGLINAGMFFGKFDTFLRAFRKYYPEVLNSEIPYSSLKRMPVDRAIFEKFEYVRVLPLGLRWEDLGTWSDWFHIVGKGQGFGGVKIGSKNVLISSDFDFTVYSFDNEDLAIVQSGKRILVMPLSKSKNLKDYLEKLK
jgi:mannose-1-phosphate guanylyltransferase